MDIKCPHSKLAHKIAVAAVILGILMAVHYVFATMENFEPTGVFRKNTPGSAKVEVYAIGRHEIVLSRENARIYDMARLGDAAAQYEFAKVLNPAPHCRDAMPGVAKEAFAWAMRAALKGDAGGENFVGMAYKEGDGVKKDRQKAIEWLTKAAEHGLAKAMCNLAILHNENGDHAKAVPFARKSALNGDSNGQFEWGRMNYHGLGVPVDYKKAVAYLSKAAKQDNPSAMSLMAVCYQLGNGVEKDIPKAINIYENLAGRIDCALQSTLAKVMLAMNYSSSDATDTESLAFKWANAALDGDGEKELRKAGHPSLIASMQYIIGLSYHNGKCVPRNDTLAESWLTKAVGGGNAEAKTVLTKMRSEKYRREQQRLAVPKMNMESAQIRDATSSSPSKETKHWKTQPTEISLANASKSLHAQIVKESRANADALFMIKNELDSLQPCKQLMKASLLSNMPVAEQIKARPSMIRLWYPVKIEVDSIKYYKEFAPRWARILEQIKIEDAKRMVVKNNIEHVREHDKSITLMFGEKPKRVFGGVMTKCDKPREYGSYHAEFESDGMALNEEYQELCFLDTRIFGKEYVLGGVYDSAEYNSYLSHFENKNRQMKRVFIDGFSGRSLQQKIDGECEFIVGLISEGNESAWTGSLYKIPQDCQDAIVEWQHRTACNVTKGERYRNTATKLEYALKFFDEDGNLISRKDFYLQNLDIMNIACVLLEDSHYDRAMDVFLGGKRLWLITPLVGGFAKKFVKWISIDIPKDDVAKIAKAVVSFEKEHLKATSSTTVNRQRVLTDAKKEERNKRAREILDNAKKEYYREKAEEERIKLYYPEAYDAYKRNHNEYKAWQQQMYRQGYW